MAGDGSVRGALRRWQDAAAAAPRLVATAVRRGLLPAGASAAETLRREGLTDLHWKLLGDALVGFLSHSGPVLAKLGQMLATRDDLLPAAVAARLESLYSGQPPMSDAERNDVLKAAYPRKRPFVRLARKPLGVGSIGQVHRARGRDGRRLVVKLVRPGVEDAIRRDVNAARVLTELFFGVFGRGDGHTRSLVLRVIGDLGRELEAEANLENEADALEEFGRRFADHPRVRVPACDRAASSRHVLVLEELSGEPLAALRDRARSDPETAKRVADLALREILSQILDDGRFHADPHGGNLLILDDGRLGLIDLGSTGTLNEEERRRISRAARAFLTRDPDAAIRALLEFGATPDDFDLEAFKADAREAFRAGRDPADAALDPEGVEKRVREIFGVARRHGIQVPPSTLLLVRALATIEGVARSLDPDIDVVVTALPVLLRSLTPRWMRWRSWRRAARGRIRRSA
jgi:ubiquinone biosynthesis protein